MAVVKCTCHMGGSFITHCPAHGERNTLIHDAEAKLRTMTTPALRKFLGRH